MKKPCEGQLAFARGYVSSPGRTHTYVEVNEYNRDLTQIKSQLAEINDLLNHGGSRASSKLSTAPTHSVCGLPAE